MEVPDINLDAISFSNNPTPSQLANAMTSIHKFLSRVGGILTADGSHTSADETVALILNSSTSLKRAADIFGSNTSGLVLPLPPANMRRQ